MKHDFKWRWRVENLTGGGSNSSTQEYLDTIIHNQKRYGPRLPLTQEVLIALKEVLDEKTR